MDKKNKIDGILKEFPKNEDSTGKSYVYYTADSNSSAGDSMLGDFQRFLKHFGSLYLNLVCFFGPVMTSLSFIRIQNKLLRKYTENDILLNIGSGPYFFKARNDFINIDIFNFSTVDIVCDANDIPIKDDSADLIVNMAVLEHVKNAQPIVDEMKRLLKDGGELLCYVPFLVPFHAAPYDFSRWTKSGAKELFKDFKEVTIKIGAGPTSALLWVAQEWLSLILSFGSSKLKDIIFIILMLITFPLKYMDLLLNYHPQAEKIASGFFIYAKK